MVARVEEKRIMMPTNDGRLIAAADTISSSDNVA